MTSFRPATVVLILLSLLIAACGGDGAAEEVDEQDAAAEDSELNADSSPGVEETEQLEWVDGVLQPLPDGFPSDALTLMVVDEPGSADGIYAREMQEALSDMSPVRVEVVDRQDFTAFGTWEALAAVSEEEGGDEGYINVISTTPSDVTDFLLVPITEELGLQPQDRNAVIATEQAPYVIAQRADAPWGDSLDDMIAYAEENPGELRYISRGVGSGLDIAMEHYMETFGITAEKIIGGPQPESAAIVGAGEGDVTILTPDVALTHSEAGRVQVIMIGGESAPEPWSDVPTGADYGVGDVPWGATRVISVTSATPDDHRDWLFELFSEAAQTEEFQEARAQIPGLTQFIMNHDEVMALSESALEAARPVVERLGLGIETESGS